MSPGSGSDLLLVPAKYSLPISYDEFVGRVRRHRPSELVPAIAALTARQELEQIRPPEERLLLPWALAAAAKESLRAGNEHRPPGVTFRDLQEIAGAYNAVKDPLLDGTETGAIHAFFTRISHEQFPYQHAEFQEVTRPYAMFGLGVEAVSTEIIKGDFWERALGCSLEQFQGVGFFLSVGAARNAGLCNLAVLEREDLEVIFHELPADIIERVTLRHFKRTPDEFKVEANNARSSDPQLRRYDYNPLVGSPFVEWTKTKMLAPVSQLVLRKVSTLGLYFIGLDSCAAPAEQGAFTQDVGEIFQAYLGRQLQDMKGAQLLPEIFYDGEKRSVDWILIFDKLVVLIEAKSTRLTQDARMGKPRLVDDVNRTVGKAFLQINNTHELIQRGHVSFTAVPTDRPIHGLVVTLEPYYLVNNPIIRELLPQPRLPVQATSIREIEHLVNLSSAEPIEQFLLKTMTDPEKSTWDLAASIGDRKTEGKNRLLSEAWDHFPWKAAAEEASDPRTEDST